MTVTEGMDVERVRSIAQQLLSQSTKIDDVRSAGDGQIRVLDQVWSGPDLEEFEDGWHEAMPVLHHAGAALRDFGRQLTRQANDQERTSEGGGGRRGGPATPPGRTQEGQSTLDRILTGIGAGISKVWDAFEGAVDWIKENIWGPLGIPLLIKDIVDGLRKVSDDVKKWTDDLLKGAGKWFDETFPKLLKWGEKLAPVGKLLTKFGKIVPGLGVAFWAWDAKDLVHDAWEGEINPADFWNKGVLGTTAMVAGFIPPYGTLIAAGIGLEQLRHEYMPQLERKLATQLGLPENSITTVRALAMAPIYPLGLADLLPNKDLDLPGPSPKEMAQSTWDAAKDAGSDLADLNPLPWP